jgi:hypothetical protein
MITVLNETTEPTDRSMPAEAITTVMPSAATATIAVCRAISSRLPVRKNCGPTRKPKITHTRNNPSTGPERLSHFVGV